MWTTILAIFLACAPKQPAEPADEQTARASEAESCQFDDDCTPPAQCLRAAGNVAGPGVCGVAIDARGRPTSNPSGQVQGCTSATGCPPYHECHRPEGASEGICIRLVP